MSDKYQPLRDAIAGPIIRSPRIAVRAAGSICVGDTRPVDTVEDLERGLHIEILGGDNTEAEAQFIAAADPDTIATLLKERDALRAAIERLVEIADRDPFQTIGFIVEHVVDLRTTITDGEASNGS